MEMEKLLLTLRCCWQVSAFCLYLLRGKKLTLPTNFLTEYVREFKR